jgi:hypothetical protein
MREGCRAADTALMNLEYMVASGWPGRTGLARWILVLAEIAYVSPTDNLLHTLHIYSKILSS